MFGRSLGLAALLLCVLSVPLLFGQGETTGSITGIVQDPSGAAIPNAKVMLKNVGTGDVRAQQTDATGGYNFSSLNLGSYNLTVEAAGFRRWVREKIPV